MTALVVYLPQSKIDAKTPWAYALIDAAQTVAKHGTAELALLPKAGVREVVAVVPIAQLSWHAVQLPKGSHSQPARLRTIVEGVLEERVLDDVEALHCALSPNHKASMQAGARTWVAACDINWLRSCIDTLEAAGYSVARMVPEFAPIAEPAANTKTHAAIDTAADAKDDTQADANATIATTPPNDTHLYAVADGVNAAWWVAVGSELLHGENPCGVLRWRMHNQTNAPHRTEDCWQPTVLQSTPIEQMQADPAVAKLAEKELQQSIAVAHASKRWQQAAQSSWDLAQFAFSRKQSDVLRKRMRQWWQRGLHAPQWQAVRWGIPVLILVQVLGLNWWAWRTRNTQQAQQQEMAQILTSTFPSVQAVIDAPVQMQRQLDVLNQNSGQANPQDMEVMLSLTAQALPDGQIQAIEWDGAQLRLKGLSVDSQQQSTWHSLLQQYGIGLQQDGVDWLLQLS